MSNYTPFEQEMLDRSRRIETRVTKIGNFIGADVGGGKPVWDRDRVQIPSRNCSIGDVIAVVPADQRHRSVPVYIGDDYVGELGLHA